MKYVQYIFIALFLLSIRTTGLSQSNQLFLHPIDHATASELQHSSGILEARLKKSGIKILTSDIKHDGLVIVVSLDGSISTENLDLLATTKGNLEFRETIDRSDFFNAISSKDPILNFIGRNLVPESEKSNAMIAEIDAADLKKVKQHLERLIKMDNLKHIEFAFGIKNEQGRTPLFSLAKEQDMVLNRNDISKIDLVSSLADQGNQISLIFSDSGAQKWADMTKNQVGRMIAIVLDDVVFMAPRVQAEITGGRAQISGLWGDGGDRVLYSILETEMLPTPFEMQLK